jgi:5-(carboxyamino)imidazole ribonucleotide synthase
MVLASGSTIGILGGGQLGRMLAIDAKSHGYRCIVRTDEVAGGPAAQVADGEYLGSYTDNLVNAAFVEACDVVTSEFENLPGELLEWLAQRKPVHPQAFSLTVCQHRRREKEFLAAHDIAHTPFWVVRSARELGVALAQTSGRSILKTAAFGYDGKGQIPLHRKSDESVAWTELGVEEAVLEQFVDFALEISVIGARSTSGEWVAFPPGENVHHNGVLDYTIAPARIAAATAAAAQQLAGRIAESLGHVGVLGVEMFVLSDGSLMVNEMAPRPHNSGHHTIEACTTSQFGQQWRAVVGAPLSDGVQHTPAVMLNLLGDLWGNGEPQWSMLRTHPNAALHLYGKPEARPGRKMGHLTMLERPGQTIDELLAQALALRTQLSHR